MVKGVGIDLMDMHRISSELSMDDSFIRKTFTEAERAELYSRIDTHEYLCTRFSLKEAVFKSLDCDGDWFQMTDIEILTNSFGKPCVHLHGDAKAYANRASIETVHVSLTYDDNFVASVAVADGPIELH